MTAGPSTDPAAAQAASFVLGRALADGAFVEVGEELPTVEAARFALEALASMGADAGADTRRAVSELVAACRRPDGGFAMTAGDPASKLAATYYAVRLSAAGRVDVSLDPEALRSWLRAALFGDRDGEVAVDVDELYYGVRALELASTPPTPSYRAATEAFVRACAARGGGFGLVPGAAPDIERTYCCLHMLQLLGSADDAGAHAGWVESCAGAGRVWWDPDRVRSSPATMYWGTRAAEIAGVELPWRELADGVEAFRDPSGGYGLDGGASLWLTYCGVRTREIARQREMVR